MGRDRVNGIAMSSVQLVLQGLTAGRSLAAVVGSTAREQINENKVRTYYVPSESFLT